jgi:hypothetical protein
VSSLKTVGTLARHFSRGRESRKPQLPHRPTHERTHHHSSETATYTVTREPTIPGLSLLASIGISAGTLGSKKEDTTLQNQKPLNGATNLTQPKPGTETMHAKTG